MKQTYQSETLQTSRAKLIKPNKLFVVFALCAISLGRMQAESALPTLRKYAALQGPNSRVGQACGWAIEQLTGEPPAKPFVPMAMYQKWVLNPIP